MKKFITVSGIGEASSHWPADLYPGAEGADTGPVAGMWKYFTDALAPLPNEMMCEQFNWQDQFGPAGGNLFGTAYRNNINGAAQALHDYVLGLPPGTEVILGGYSGGAHVVSLAAPMIEASLASGLYDVGQTKLIAIVFVANPARAQEDSDAPWWGITGQRELLLNEFVYRVDKGAGVSHDVSQMAPGKTLVLDLANPADVIPCCPSTPLSVGVYPLRAFYKVADEFSLMNFPQWGIDALRWLMYNMMSGGGIDLSPVDWFVCMQYVYGYLWGGQHTSWYEVQLPGLAKTARAMLGLDQNG